MIHLTSEMQFNDFIKENDLVVLDFSATWCGPCKVLAPQLESLSKVYPNVVFLKVDVDEFEDIASTHNVSAMPTIMFYKNGQVIKHETVVGGGQITQIEQVIQKYSE
jgi:thioredoxin 1